MVHEELSQTCGRRFSHDLLETLSKEGLSVEKVHRESGKYITGVVVRPEVYQRDYAYGAPLETSIMRRDSEGPESTGHMAGLLSTRYSEEAVKPSVWAPLDANIYERYIELIGTDNYVTTLNRWTKQMDDITDRLVQVHVEGAKIASQAVRDSLRTVVQRGVGQIRLT